ncbi:hypothetical protein NQ318_005364 [Aromia moschata]|uniref:Transposase n=1 Tax=Aromia moschata TaxID=1265417 RepID=A0AAV8YWA2_9CUCU|nr:hypothetical protein NQ318_005364 [Aromia moschata]
MVAFKRPQFLSPIGPPVLPLLRVQSPSTRCGYLITELMLLSARCGRVATSLNRTVSGDTFPTLSSLDKPVEQRVNLKFLVEPWKTFTEAYAMLKEVYGNEYFKWFKRFKEGCETTEEERPERPSTKTDENIEKIGKLIRKIVAI